MNFLMRWVTNALRFTARVDVFFYLMLYLMVLLVVGTLAQKDMGLYAAQHLYFSTFFFDFYGVPLPAGYTVLGFMFVGLLYKTFSEKFTRKTAGSFVTHLSVCLLFLGGFLTAYYSHEGYMVIEEGQSSNYYNDYYQAELAFVEVGEMNQGHVYAMDMDDSVRSLSFNINDSNLSIKVLNYVENSEVKRYKTPKSEEDAHISYKTYAIEALPENKVAELNLSALQLMVNNQKYTIYEGMAFSPHLQLGESVYQMVLRQKRYYVPWRVALDSFKKHRYTGVDQAKAYESFVYIYPKDGPRFAAHIQMNEPLRYEDFTLFQSSYVEGSKDATVLAVVQNKGRLFPYIASLVMAVGLLLHLFLRLPKLMRKTTCLAVVFALSHGYAVSADALPTQHSFEIESFKQMPVLENGRIKPLDSFARHQLLQFAGRESLPHLNAEQFINTVLFKPYQAYDLAVFKIRNPALVGMLKLPKTEKSLYSFKQVFNATKPFLAEIEKLKVQRETLPLLQSQLLQLHENSVAFYDLSRSLTMLLPIFDLPEEFVIEIGLKPQGRYSYLDLRPLKNKFLEMAGRDQGADKLQQALALFKDIEGDYQSTLLKIIPQQWGDGDEWYSPWQALHNGQGSAKTSKFFDVLTQKAFALQIGDDDQGYSFNMDDDFTVALQNLYQNVAGVDDGRLKLEFYYNKVSPFFGALVAMLMVLVCWAVFQAFKWQGFYVLSKASLWLGFALLTCGLLMRMYIMGRPPVATLYESIIFVSWVTALFAYIFEKRRQDCLGLFVGGLVTLVLLFVSSRYALDGDTMGNLEAVLNTNFWLATHVLTITIGYGCCLIAGALAHVYLFARLRGAKASSLQHIQKNTLAAALIALLFCSIGTILGGIWADQSWGRFWGWDPKENGALLICLWLIWLLHGRISGQLRSLYFAALMALTNVVVALAWFGVNLLGVGLHSYGFTQHIAVNLTAFCLLEIAVVATLLACNYVTDKAVKLKGFQNE